MGEAARPVRWRYRRSITAGAAATEYIIDLPDTGAGGDDRRSLWRIHSVTFVRTGGAAANYTLRILAATGVAAGNVDSKIEYAALAVGTRINEVYGQPVPIASDATNRVYFIPTWDAGADNAADVEIWFEPVLGASGDGTV